MPAPTWIRTRAKRRHRSSSRASTVAPRAVRSIATGRSSSVDFSAGRSGLPDRRHVEWRTNRGRAAGAAVSGGQSAASPGAVQTPARGQAPIATSVSFTRNGQTFTVPLGSLTGSADGFLNSHQPNARVDVSSVAKHTLTARYLNNLHNSIATHSRPRRPGRLCTTIRTSTAPTSG